jgi:antitoxin component HigA of HigAB toxin-antitoxin module
MEIRPIHSGADYQAALKEIEKLIGVSQSTGCCDRLNYLRSLVVLPKHQECVVYSGKQSMQPGAGTLISWRNLDSVLENNNFFKNL